MKRRKGLAACAFFVLLSGGVLAASEGLWLDVPYVHQEKDGCGSAAVAMVMQYWIAKHAAISPDRANPIQIQRELYSREAHGIYASAIQQYLRNSGLDAFAFRGEWKDFREHIAKGRPLLVALKPGSGAALHYVVIAGVSPDDTAVIVNDPARSKLLRVNRDEFVKGWRGTDYWTLLTLPKQSQ